MRLILTRHGETVENKERRMQGHVYGSLSELGKEQARRLALRLKVEKIDYIYSSDLERAANTAREISQCHPHTPITFVKDLREGDWGKIAGKLKMDLTGDPQKNPERKDYPTDAEQRDEMQKRVMGFLHQVLHRHPHSTVLFVGHGEINNALLNGIKGLHPEEFATADMPPNTAVTILDVQEDKSHTIHLHNCTKHLE